METDVYKTIAAPAQGIYKEKGSKFLSYAYPVTCSEQVKPIVDALKAEYYDARHHCFAYRIGQHGDQWRAVDDGEPSATAGRPILGQLLSAQVTDILVVVVRYFGGTKLGVSGLITAYKEATIDVLQQAQIIEKTVDVRFTLNFGYALMNDAMRLTKDFEVKIVEQNFDNQCTITLSIRQSAAEFFREKASKIEGLKISIKE